MRLMGQFTEKRALAATLCWVAALALTGSTDALLFLAPALLIAIPLLCGRYFGEELIVRLVEKAAKPSPRPRPVLPLPRAPRTWRPSGSRVIGFSLAERPPPTALFAQN